jgi:GTP-binding protein HflX
LRAGNDSDGGAALADLHETNDLNEVHERTVLVGVDLPELFGRGAGDCDLAELGQLVDTAGGIVVGQLRQKRMRPAPATFIGKGKVSELEALVADTDATLVVCDNDLSPAQGRNLEKRLNAGEDRGELGRVSVIDRTELILDIFARHARTRQARLQVELAQLQYMLPRLVKLWSHLERQEGGIGTRGPGETQLETDRRIVGRRLARLKKELAVIAADRGVQTKRRGGHFKVSLVGYTNAGKSTLMRAITGADVLVENQLFATLDATTRRVEVDERRQFLLSDTVGFIRRLPLHLVASFRATLQEVAEADLLLHVVDASSEDPERQIASVNEVLADIAPGERDTIMVFNKLDLLPPDAAETFRNSRGNRHTDALFVSALAEDGPAAVRSAVVDRLLGREQVVRLQLPLTRMDLVAVFHRTGSVLDEEHDVRHCRLAVRLRERELKRLLGREPDIEVLP